MNLRAFIKIFSLMLLGGYLILGTPAFAWVGCTGKEANTLEEQLYEADVIFLGKVVNAKLGVKFIGRSEYRVVRFQIHERFKGNISLFTSRHFDAIAYSGHWNATNKEYGTIIQQGDLGIVAAKYDKSIGGYKFNGNGAKWVDGKRIGLIPIDGCIFSPVFFNPGSRKFAEQHYNSSYIWKQFAIQAALAAFILFWVIALLDWRRRRKAHTG